MREKYESLSATVLRDLAKSRGIKSTSTMKKADLVEAMLAEDAKKEKEKAAKESEKKQEQSAPSEKPERKRADSAESAKEGSKEGEREEASQDDTIKNLDSGITVNGISGRTGGRNAKRSIKRTDLCRRIINIIPEQSWKRRIARKNLRLS